MSRQIRNQIFGISEGSTAAGWYASNSQYRSVYQRFPTKPPSAISTLQNTMVSTLVTGGVWAKLDGLIVVNSTEGQSLLNWIKNNHNLTKQGTISFTSLYGFKGHTADNSYMEMDFNPSVDGSTYTQTEAHIGCYVNSEVEEDHTFLFGNSSGGTLVSPATGMIWRNASWQGKVNQGANAAGDMGEFQMPGRNKGHVIWQRKSDGKIYGYFNGYPQSVSGVTVTGTNLRNDQWEVFRNHYTGLNRLDNGFAVIHYGGLLTDADIALLYSALQTYLVAIGANEDFGTTKLVDLDFEENTYLRKGAWSLLAGAPDYQYAIAPISGTKSSYWAAADTARLFFPIYSGSVQIKFAIKFNDATPASNQDYFFFGTDAATTLGYLRLYTTGRTLLTSGGKTNYGATVMADNTVYYMWLEYVKGTGADSTCRLYLNTVDTKPATPECEITAGNATGNCNRITPYGVTGGQWIDNLVITPL